MLRCLASRAALDACPSWTWRRSVSGGRALLAKDDGEQAAPKSTYTDFLRKQAERRAQELQRRARLQKRGQFPVGPAPLHVNLVSKPRSPFIAEADDDDDNEGGGGRPKLARYEDTRQGTIDRLLEEEARLSGKLPPAAQRFAATLRGDEEEEEEEEEEPRRRRRRRDAKKIDEEAKQLSDVDYELEEMKKQEADLLLKEANFERQRAWQRSYCAEHCLGCGGKLQSDDPLGVGYVPPELLETVKTQPLRKQFVREKQTQKQSPWMAAATALLARQPAATADELYPDGKVPADDDLRFRSLRDVELEHGVEERSFVCVRCHALRAGQLSRVGPVDLSWQTSEDVRKRLRQMFGHRKFLAVVVVDLANFEASFVRDVETLVGGNRVLLVGNKLDLLPVGANAERVRVWLKARAEERNLHNIRRTVVLSAFTGEGMRQLCAEINCLRQDDDVVLIGATNVGKSTLLNGVVPRLFPGAKTHATTSGLPGTTLSLISFPFDGPSPSYVREQQEARRRVEEMERASESNPYTPLRLVGANYPLDAKAERRRVAEPPEPVSAVRTAPKLIDTPGLVQYDHVDHLLEPTELRSVQISRRVRPQIYRLVAGKTLFLGGLARVDYVRGPPLYVTVFVSRNLTVHATNVAAADDLYRRQKGQLLSPPACRADDPLRLDRFPPLEPYKVVVNSADIYDLKSWRRAFADISVGGVGWLSLTGGSKDRERCHFVVHVPSGISVAARPPIMPFEAEPLKRKNVVKHGKVPPSKAILHPLSRERTVG